jgi:transitional endoplasmic reticulum ATPase
VSRDHAHGTGHFHAAVDRWPGELPPGARCLALFDSVTLARHNLKDDEVVRIATERGRSVLARVVAGEEPGGDGIVRLDRFVRQALKAHLNEEVEIEKAQPKPVRKVELVPAVDVATAHDLVDHLKKVLVESRSPVSIGSVLYVTFPDSPAGTTYEVFKLEDGAGVISEETEITLHYYDAHTPEGAFDVTFDEIGGLHRQIALVRELVQLPLQFPAVYRQLGISPPRGIIFYGPPGTGKTHLARAIANEIHARFYYINGPDIMGTYAGETEANLRRMFMEASHHAPSIIFIDELDAVAPKRGETGAHSDTRLVTQLLSLMDGLKRVDAVIVIATTNRIEAVDVALRRPGRFDREVFFGPPDAEERLEILRVHTREMPLANAALDFLPEVAELTHGFVGADLMELCRESGLHTLRRSSSGLANPRLAFRFKPENLVIEKEDLVSALAKIQPSAMRETLVTIPGVTWADIGGLQGVKDRLRLLVARPLRQSALGTGVGKMFSSGILLYGPPGTGKTLLAKAIAHECGVNFIAVDGPELFTKWLGESEEGVRHIFRIARQVAPSIVFFDQLDAIAPIRGEHTGVKTTERVVNQLLSELDGIKPLGNVIVIAATNRLDLVDLSMLRPGRFGAHVYVPLPNQGEREEILKLHLRNVPLAAEVSLEAFVADLAAQTEGFSGADLAHLCGEAGLAALMEENGAPTPALTQSHFVKALQSMSARNK